MIFLVWRLSSLSFLTTTQPFINMSKVAAPELKKYMDKLLFINVQGNRKISGVLRGFDIFLNLVIDEARDESSAEKVNCGQIVIRGNSVTSIEMLATR